MSVQSMTLAFAQPIPSCAKIVLLALANHADDVPAAIAIFELKR